jgi:hypothetical protein
VARTRPAETGFLSHATRERPRRHCSPQGSPACVSSGLLYPVEPRKEPNFSYRLLRAIYPAFRLLFPNQVIRADDLARATVDVALRRTGEPGGQIFENHDIRAMVESIRPPNA